MSPQRLIICWPFDCKMCVPRASVGYRCGGRWRRLQTSRQMRYAPAANGLIPLFGPRDPVSDMQVGDEPSWYVSRSEEEERPKTPRIYEESGSAWVIRSRRRCVRQTPLQPARALLLRSRPPSSCHCALVQPRSKGLHRSGEVDAIRTLSVLLRHA